MSAPRSIVVVGASLAGLRAVDALRRRGFDGTLTWIGEESRLPYDRPPLSKQVLRGEWTPDRTALKANYDALGADLRLGRRATSLDVGARRVSLDDGTSVPFDGLVVATGAAPRKLPGMDALSGVHVLRTLDDALRIREELGKKPRVAIVGGGYVGLEVAASCRALGLDVTVVEALPLPLAPAIGETMAREIVEMHRAEGVDVRTSSGVSGFVGERDVEGLRLSDGSVVFAELVVVGIGVVPNTAWLEGSGVALDGGVLCDSRLRTNVPGIVACGDVVRFENALFGERMRVEHWTSAVEQASAAVASLLDGDAAPPLATVPYFWSDQYDAKIQFAGRVAPNDALKVLEGSVKDRNLVAIYGRAGKMRGVLVVNKPAALIRNRKAITDGAAFPD
ncbi:MAG TPA: FAD-dependent oxidoreductase [Polyangiaceae bacterium]|nr:FAD-dependent oxidoreductase [Polyangiaceae bacterium]